MPRRPRHNPPIPHHHHGIRNRRAAGTVDQRCALNRKGPEASTGISRLNFAASFIRSAIAA